MKKNHTVGLVTALLVTGLYATVAHSSDPAKTASVKFSNGPEQCSLLEMYTSEAKSDCIPAEKWFSEIKGSAGLWKSFVPVSFHVDNWDSLGWKDKLASKDFGRRLAAYARQWSSSSAYAPAIVVDGIEWGGWSRDQDVPAASGRPGVLSVDISRTGSLTVAFTPTDESSQSWTAHGVIVGFDILSKIQEGENRGRQLRYDFAALGYQKENMRLSYGKFKTVLRSLSARKDVSSKRYAVVVWVTRQDNPLPVQATGGYLPEQA